MSGKIGVIWVGHQCEDSIERSLRPWIEARREKLAGHEILICAVSVPFQGFEQSEERDRTLSILDSALKVGEIDHIISSDTPMKETEARGAALKWLVSKDADILIQWDSDEFPQIAELEKIIRFIDANPFADCFRFSYKNLVFTENQYLAEPFTPMRAHRVKIRNYITDHFWDDNNVMYRGTITRDFRRDIDMVVKTVPKGVAWIKHATWLNDLRSKKKISYQLDARGWPSCSFAWDDSKGGLIFNPALPEPEVIKED